MAGALTPFEGWYLLVVAAVVGGGIVASTTWFLVDLWLAGPPLIPLPEEPPVEEFSPVVQIGISPVPVGRNDALHTDTIPLPIVAAFGHRSAVPPADPEEETTWAA